MASKVTNRTDKPITFGGVTVAGGDSAEVEPVTPAMRLMEAGGAIEIVGAKKPRGKKADEPSEREKAIMAAIEGLTADDLTQDGKPEVDAINTLIEGDPVTADERDAVWAKRK